MKKKYVKIFFIILAVFIGINFSIYSYTVLKDNSLSKKEISISDEQYEVIRNILYSVETGNGVYGEKEYENFTEALNISKNEKSITLGAGAFYGDNAKKLLIRIKEKYPGIFEYYDDCLLEEDLKLETWDEYAIEKNSKKGLAIINIIGTKEGIIIQDEMMNEMIFSYLKEAKLKGINEMKAQVMYGSIIHLGGKKAANRILNHISKPYTFNKIYRALNREYIEDKNLNTPVNSELFKKRHKNVYKQIKEML